MSLLFLEGDLLVGLAVGSPMTSSWKIVKRHGLLLRGACHLQSGEKYSRKEMKLVLHGIASKKKVSLHGVWKTSMVTRISPTDVPYFVCYLSLVRYIFCVYLA
jgi:hypothetical protein